MRDLRVKGKNQAKPFRLQEILLIRGKGKSGGKKNQKFRNAGKLVNGVREAQQRGATGSLRQTIRVHNTPPLRFWYNATF